jgi:hypothetical protein
MHFLGIAFFADVASFYGYHVRYARLLQSAEYTRISAAQYRGENQGARKQTCRPPYLEQPNICAELKERLLWGCRKVGSIRTLSPVKTFSFHRIARRTVC